ncbi:hypothetical protein COX84_06735, partial [Candidatus Micrarchaeota archaeon CG_4_10_14_0_2_um_filter_49_7]
EPKVRDPMVILGELKQRVIDKMQQAIQIASSVKIQPNSFKCTIDGNGYGVATVVVQNTGNTPITLNADVTLTDIADRTKQFTFAYPGTFTVEAGRSLIIQIPLQGLDPKGRYDASCTITDPKLELGTPITMPDGTTKTVLIRTQYDRNNRYAQTQSEDVPFDILPGPIGRVRVWNGLQQDRELKLVVELRTADDRKELKGTFGPAGTFVVPAGRNIPISFGVPNLPLGNSYWLRYVIRDVKTNEVLVDLYDKNIHQCKVAKQIAVAYTIPEAYGTPVRQALQGNDRKLIERARKLLPRDKQDVVGRAERLLTEVMFQTKSDGTPLLNDQEKAALRKAAVDMLAEHVVLTPREEGILSEATNTGLVDEAREARYEIKVSKLTYGIYDGVRSVNEIMAELLGKLAEKQRQLSSVQYLNMEPPKLITWIKPGTAGERSYAIITRVTNTSRDARDRRLLDVEVTVTDVKNENRQWSFAADAIWVGPGETVPVVIPLEGLPAGNYSVSCAMMDDAFELGAPVELQGGGTRMALIKTDQDPRARWTSVTKGISLDIVPGPVGRIRVTSDRARRVKLTPTLMQSPQGSLPKKEIRSFGPTEVVSLEAGAPTDIQFRVPMDLPAGSTYWMQYVLRDADTNQVIAQVVDKNYHQSTPMKRIQTARPIPEYPQSYRNLQVDSQEYRDGAIRVVASNIGGTASATVKVRIVRTDAGHEGEELYTHGEPFMIPAGGRKELAIPLAQIPQGIDPNTLGVELLDVAMEEAVEITPVPLETRDNY